MNPDTILAVILDGFYALPRQPEEVNGVISITRRNVVRNLHKLADHIERGGVPPEKGKP